MTDRPISTIHQLVQKVVVLDSDTLPGTSRHHRHTHHPARPGHLPKCAMWRGPFQQLCVSIQLFLFLPLATRCLQLSLHRGSFIAALGPSFQRLSSLNCLLLLQFRRVVAPFSLCDGPRRRRAGEFGKELEQESRQRSLPLSLSLRASRISIHFWNISYMTRGNIFAR